MSIFLSTALERVVSYLKEHLIGPRLDSCTQYTQHVKKKNINWIRVMTQYIFLNAGYALGVYTHWCCSRAIDHRGRLTLSSIYIFPF